MAYLIGVGRHRRSRQKELPEFVAMIDFEPNRIPQLGSKLPFVNEARRSTSQQLEGCYLR